MYPKCFHDTTKMSFTQPPSHPRTHWHVHRYILGSTLQSLMSCSLVCFSTLESVFDLSTAQRALLSHAVAGPTADAEGGGGQRKVQTENPYSDASSSFATVCAFSRGDPSVSCALCLNHKLIKKMLLTKWVRLCQCVGDSLANIFF